VPRRDDAAAVSQNSSPVFTTTRAGPLNTHPGLGLIRCAANFAEVTAAIAECRGVRSPRLFAKQAERRDPTRELSASHRLAPHRCCLDSAMSPGLYRLQLDSPTGRSCRRLGSCPHSLPSIREDRLDVIWSTTPWPALSRKNRLNQTWTWNQDDAKRIQRRQGTDISPSTVGVREPLTTADTAWSCPSEQWSPNVSTTNRHRNLQSECYRRNTIRSSRNETVIWASYPCPRLRSSCSRGCPPPYLGQRTRG
jgi:hypothetical protein